MEHLYYLSGKSLFKNLTFALDEWEQEMSEEEKMEEEKDESISSLNLLKVSKKESNETRSNTFKDLNQFAPEL